MARHALALTIALLSSGCSDVTAPAVDRVEFDRHTATLWAGRALTTSVTVSRTNGEVVANPSVTYTSSNSQVASVDGTGKVRAHAAGQATISATVESITDELEVTVRWPPVTAVVFTHDSLVMAVGDTVAPGVIVLNIDGNWPTYATLSYSSSAPSIVAAVDREVRVLYEEGRIAAVGEGRATITVTADRISDFLPVIVTPR